MKKRLSLLMVVMMIVSLLPMSAFAATTGGALSSPINPKVDSTNPVNVSFSLDASTNDVIKPGKLLVSVDNAEFDSTFAAGNVVMVDNVAKDSAGASRDLTKDKFKVTAVKVSNTQLELTIGQLDAAPTTDDAKVAANEALSINFNVPMLFKKEGEAKLTVEDLSTLGNIGFRLAPKTFAYVGTKDDTKLAISVADSEATMSYDGGELSKFTITNIPTGTNQITVEVDKGLNWDTTDTKAVLVGGNIADVGTLSVDTDGKLVIPFSQAFAANDSNARLIITPVFDVAGRKAGEGSVRAYVEATDTTNAVIGYKGAKNSAYIGKLVDYGITMTVVEDGKKEIPNVWGGEEATVLVTVKGPKGSIVKGDMNFKVEGASVKATNVNSSAGIKIDGTSAPSAYEFKGYNNEANTENYKNDEFYVTGFAGTEEKAEFKLTIVTDADKDGVAKITASQGKRVVWEETADLAKVTPKFVAKAEVTPVKKGEAKATADVVITEAKAGLLERGERITLSFDTKRDYVEFTKKPVAEATNGMKFDKDETKWIYADNTNAKSEKIGVSLLVDKASSGEPAVITISGMNVAVDGSITDDIVKVKAGLEKRNAATPAQGRNAGSDVSVIDYIKVVKEYDMESILSVFTIGQTAYTVNGETKAAHSAPYIKAGRTMLPIRAVAESLGLTVQWNSATRTASFTDASKVAAVTIGAKVMYVNGTPMPLTVPAELVNDTTFVELRSLATAFGVQIDWDAAAKTATVSK